MTEPYQKAGRGGAGNFYSKQDIADASKITDIEAGPKLTVSAQPPPPPEYMHSGRGGAGNWVKPSELTSQGLAQQSSPNPTSTAAVNATTKRVVGSSKPMYRGGRGGAGNYRDEAEEERQRVEEEARLRESMEKRVQQDVEQGLARPPRAYGGIGGAWEMGSMQK